MCVYIQPTHVLVMSCVWRGGDRGKLTQFSSLLRPETEHRILSLAANSSSIASRAVHGPVPGILSASVHGPGSLQRRANMKVVIYSFYRKRSSARPRDLLLLNSWEAADLNIGRPSRDLYA